MTNKDEQVPSLVVDGIRAPRCNMCGHQMIRDCRSRANDQAAIWYCPTPERHQ